MTNEERIKADAEAYLKTQTFTNRVQPYEGVLTTGYIAGATAVHDRAQVLVDTLEEIIKMSNAGKTLSHIDSHVAAKARKALEQWNGGKEVKDVCTCSLSHLAAHGECYKCPGRHTRSNLTNPQK